MRSRTVFLAAVLAAVPAVIPSVAAAGGCMFPEANRSEMPEISSQRALISYRAGVETIVVESTYESDSPTVGWVLPLPAEPSKLEVAEGGTLTSLSICLRPRVTHRLGRLAKIPVFILICLVSLIYVPIFIKHHDRRLHLVLLLAALVLSGLVAAMFFLPSQPLGGLDAMAGVRELFTQRVGSYEVTVLKAADKDALSKWLKSHWFKPLDEKAKKIVADYVSRKWCFVVARLRKDVAERVTPHPIAATFPAARPIFPMKLTALDGTKTHVELFVVGKDRASVEGFHCVASDRFVKVGEPRAGSYMHVAASYRGKETGLVIGSPDLARHLWQGCVVTKLTADLQGEQQMARDVEIKMNQAGGHRDHFYSQHARRDVIGLVALWGLLALMLFIGVTFRRRRRPKRLRRLVAIGVLVGAVLLASWLVHSAMPVKRVGVSKIGPDALRVRSSFLSRAAFNLVEDGLLHKNMTIEQLAQFPDKALKKGIISHRHVRNPLTNRRMRFERSPGNFSVRKVADSTFICFYDEDGREVRVKLPDPAPKAP